MTRKIKVEHLKETRPEKELSSDSEESSAADGTSLFVLIHTSVQKHFLLQILIPMSGEKARPNPKPLLPEPQTMTLILKMTKTTKPTTNLLAAEAHLPGMCSFAIFFRNSQIRV